MEKKEILKICAESGFLLNKKMLDFFVELEEKEVCDVISKLKGLNFGEKILTDKIFEKYKKKIGYFEKDCEDFESNLKILKNFGEKSGKIEAKDFVSYFRARFDRLKDVLLKNNLTNLTSIRRIGFESGIFCVIGMISSKKITKNKNLLIEIEDLTGKIVVLVNRDNKQLFEQAKNLLLDDVLAFKVSGSSKMLFADEFVYPDCCLDNEKFGRKDEFVAFTGDFHVGSRFFLEENLNKFVNWLNGEVGDDRQRAMARKVRYLVLNGDNIDGVGVYPGQEDFLKIRGCRAQYDKLAEILGRIRQDIEIILVPGSSDAVWLGEPQPGIGEKWVLGLKNLKNLKIVSNPSFFDIEGLKFFVYHGGSLNKFVDEMESLRMKDGRHFPLLVVEEILRRRHLAPVYGDMDIVPSRDEDELVLEEVPDVFVVGGQHCVDVSSYNNILTISSGCFQGRTDFEERVGKESDPCKVPILNLRSREVKILDFSDEVRWEDGEVCELGVRDG